MRVQRAIGYGVLGAGAISVLSAILRAIGMPIGLEMLLGTSLGMAPSATAFAVGLVLHFALGGAFGLLYGWLFETVWVHGGAFTGMLLGTLHAAVIGMAVGLTPHFHPMVPAVIADPGPFFANLGTLGVTAFFAMHLLYGAIVGHGYGHVANERQWAPAGRL